MTNRNLKDSVKQLKDELKQLKKELKEINHINQTCFSSGDWETLRA